MVLTGWGRTPRSTSHVRNVSDHLDIELVDDARGQVARGLGRSYGDASLNSGGLVWRTTGLARLDIDESGAFATVGAGVSYATLLDVCVPRGLFPPVTPGTKHVTMGGAIAADVHGKNHHRDGSIGNHLVSLQVLTGHGDIQETRPGEELFEATVGGMGLTGVIVEASLKLFEIDSPYVEVDTVRTDDLRETFNVMGERDENFHYSVAWVDLIHRTNPGRGVVTFGNHSRAGDASGWKATKPLAKVPGFVPTGLINRVSVKAFNELWYFKAPVERTLERQTFDQFFYPLDIADDWNRLYGKSGLIQYQVVIPFGHENVVEDAIAAIQRGPAPPSLAVLKRFGAGRGLLSFPKPGWTLAVDFPATHMDQNDILNAIDEQVAAVGGRVYLAKDSRLSPVFLPAMYPDLDEWRQIADKADPQRRFRSDLDRRLSLRGPG